MIVGGRQMVGVYFSGTGNTRYCVEKFCKEYDNMCRAISIEDDSVLQLIKENHIIVLGYPVYFSNLPKIVRDFINNNKELFNGKKVFIIATMGLFSGDGTGVSARLLKKYGVEVIGGLHLKMPDCIGDEKALKKSLEKNQALVKSAENKICMSVEALKNGNPTKEGISTLYHLAGLFGQRLWFYNKTKNYSNKIKINHSKCIGCGICENICPMKNLYVVDNKAQGREKCTMCYRCVSNCPKEAITLLGKKVYEQSRIEKYTTNP